jgi:hypothetical protein
MKPPRPLRQLSLASSLACALAWAASGLAAQARPEASAQAALKRAAADYRAKRYATAGTRLTKALGGCGDDQCAPATRAALLRDLGTMQFRQGDTAAASQSFADALGLQPDLDLNARYDKPDVRAAWNDAKERAANAAKASNPPPEEPAPPPAPEPAPSPPPPPPDEGEEGKTQGPPRYEHLWIGVAGAFDLLVFPSGTDLCKLSPRGLVVNSVNAYCTNPDGTDFPTRMSNAQNEALVPGEAGTIKGGLQIGDVRAMVAVDYAFTPAVLVGVRVGYVMNTYQGTAAVQDGRAYGRPIHAELRGTYLFGKDPLANVGFAPMAFLAGGLSEFDGHLATDVTIEGVAGTRRVNIWVTDGPWFVTVGGGMRYQFSLRAAFTAAVRLNASFHGNGVLPTAGPELGFQYGF